MNALSLSYLIFSNNYNDPNEFYQNSRIKFGQTPTSVTHVSAVATANPSTKPTSHTISPETPYSVTNKSGNHIWSALGRGYVVPSLIKVSVSACFRLTPVCDRRLDEMKKRIKPSKSWFEITNFTCSTWVFLWKTRPALWITRQTSRRC